MRLEEMLMEGNTDHLRMLIASPVPDLHPLQSQSIDARWKEWEPWMAIEARKQPDPSSVLYNLKAKHRSRTIALLGAGVTWKQIRTGRLDEPTMGENLFQFSLRAARTRHLAMKENVGRRKKVSKKQTGPGYRKTEGMKI